MAELVKALPRTKDLIIAEHMHIAKVIGQWYARRNRRNLDDLIGAAYLGLCQAVAWAPERLRDCNISPYIASTIHRFCRECIEADHTVVIERRSRIKYRKERGEGRCTEITIDPAIEQDPAAPLLAAELLESFCPRHRAVIELRVAGYTQCEIAEQLNVSQPMIHKYLKEIKESTPQLKDLL